MSLLVMLSFENVNLSVVKLLKFEYKTKTVSRSDPVAIKHRSKDQNTDKIRVNFKT